MRSEISNIFRRKQRKSRRSSVQDSSVMATAAEGSFRDRCGVGSKQQGGRCCWSEMPPELLREVLRRIEASESGWPARRAVVACAGVCRSWRAIAMEIVKTPEASGQLTFPISVKQPGPRESLLQCFIKRNRTTRTYYLYLSLTQALAEDGKFLLAARKYKHPTCTDYVMSLRADGSSRSTRPYIGKLRSNFFGTKFTVYDGQPPHAGFTVAKSRSARLGGGLKQVFPTVPAGNYPVAHISYEMNVLGSRGPRKMECIMDAISASAIELGGQAPTQTKFLPSNSYYFPSLQFLCSRSSRMKNFSTGSLTGLNDVMVLKNKTPRWHEQLQCWCLNFHGRVTVASVKNFQLVAVAASDSGRAEQEHETVILQFGKVGKDVFTMDYRYPISAFQAFAICLSSFDTKIACE